MAREMARRPLFWEGSSKRDFKQFPTPVQKDMGVALFVVQLGGTPPSAKPWKGLGAGVYELIEDPSRRHLSRSLHSEDHRPSSRVARFSEEVEIGGQNAKGGCGLIERRLKSVLERTRKDSRN